MNFDTVSEGVFEIYKRYEALVVAFLYESDKIIDEIKKLSAETEERYEDDKYFDMEHLLEYTIRNISELQEKIVKYMKEFSAAKGQLDFAIKVRDAYNKIIGDTKEG